MSNTDDAKDPLNQQDSKHSGSSDPNPGHNNQTSLSNENETKDDSNNQARNQNLDNTILISALNITIEESIRRSNQELTSKFEKAIEESANSTIQKVQNMVHHSPHLTMGPQDYAQGNSTTVNMQVPFGSVRVEPYVEPSRNNQLSNDEFKYQNQYNNDDQSHEFSQRFENSNEQNAGNTTQAPIRPKGIDPIAMLGQVTRLVKQAYLQNTQVSYEPWLEYIKSLLKACLLNCVCLMIPHLVPKTEEHWQELDIHHLTLQWKEYTIRHLRVGMFVEVSKGDHIQKLNGIFLGVTSFCPQLIHLLHAHLCRSLHVSMRFLIKNENVNVSTFRLILFGGINNFVLTTAAAKSIRFKGFLGKQEYQVTESIEAFNVRLQKEALEINELYCKEVISEPMIKEILISCIMAKTGNRYVNTLDSCRNEDLSFQATVKRLNDKYLDTKSRGNVSHSINSATAVSESKLGERTHLESASLASGSSGGGSTTSTLPCFQYKRTGKCSFGQKCKYSHNSRILSEAKLPDHADLVVAQLCELQEHCNAVISSRNKFKKNYNNSRLKLQKYKAGSKLSDKTVKDQKRHIEDVIASAADTQPSSSSGLPSGAPQDNDEEDVQISSEDSDLSDEDQE